MTVCQRWRGGRASYRRPDEPIKTLEHEVAPIDRETAKAFVVEHHYSGSYPADRFRFGLFRGAALVGVAVFSVPVRDEVLTRVFPGPADEATELGRFVLLDEVAGNGETWFLARCLDALRRDGLRGVVAFSDPMPRRTSAGRLVMPGHVGTIYQASNAHALPRARADTLLLLPDGRSFPRRSLAKAQKGDSRWRGPVAALVAAGADAPRCLARNVPDAAELGPWVERWAARLLRPMRHPGNHRYAFPLTRSDRRRLAPNPADYPKRST